MRFPWKIINFQNPRETIQNTETFNEQIQYQVTPNKSDQIETADN
jgi:hypothetical protein